MKLKLSVELKDKDSCAGCPVFRWDDNDLIYRCFGQKEHNIYWEPDTGKYVNRDKCPLQLDSCCGGGCHK
jgi:hypothetical protein